MYMQKNEANMPNNYKKKNGFVELAMRSFHGLYYTMAIMS
jgi:hypothetical protein